MSSRQYRFADHHFSRNENAYYWQDYGFTRDPFPVIPDYSLTLLLARWEHHLDLLQHLIHTENVMLAVLGPKGSGKTTLLQQLVNQLGDSMFIHRAISRPNLDLNQLVKLIHDGFKLPVVESDLVEEKLDSLIADIQYQERICVLAVDNAQDLPEETLQGLLYLIRQQSKTQMRFHVVLFGDHELQMKLAKIAKQDMSGDIIHSLELEPLTLEETKQYLNHRLTVAGLKENMPLSAITIENIFHESHGLPEHINRLAQQALIDEIAEDPSSMTSSSQGFISQNLTKILGGVVVALFIGVTSYFVKSHHEQQNRLAYKQQENQMKSAAFAQNDRIATDANNTNQPYFQIKQANANQEANPPQAVNVAGQVPVPNNVNIANTSQQNGQTVVAVNNNANNNYANNADDADSSYFQNSNASAQATVPVNNNQVAQQTPLINNNNQNNQTNVATNPAQAATPANLAPVNNNVAQTATSANLASVNNNVAQAAAPVNIVPANNNVEQASQALKTPQTTASPVSSQVVASAASTVSNPAPTAQVTKVAQQEAPIDPLKHEDMVAHKAKAKVKKETATKAANQKNEKSKLAIAKKEGRYTLQVMALSSESAARKFIDNNHLSGKMQVIKTKHEGKTLYILTYGAYSSNEQARSAMRSLPKAIQKNTVWPRSVASLNHEATVR